jgi:hypothetical protein
MNDKLSLIASVGVIALVAYGAYLLSDIDKAAINRINNTLKAVSDTVGTDDAKVTINDPRKVIIGSGIAILLIAAIYVLLKRGK